MKKLFLLLLGVTFVLVLFSSVSALCNINVSLLNQDPYPAVPGDYVKLLFQVTGLNNFDCGVVKFQLFPQFPISFDPGVSPITTVNSGIYVPQYSSSVLIPYKVRIDKNALDGENQIQLGYSHSLQENFSSYVSSYFDVVVNNTETDFQVIVNSYSYSTQTLTLGIINTGKNNVQALTVSIPNDGEFNFTGSNDQIIGTLASSDDTTVTFSGVPNGNKINVILSYNDLNGFRRTLNKSVDFSKSTYLSTVSNGQSHGISYYLLILTWIALIVYFVYRYFKNKRKRKMNLIRK